MNTSFKCTRLSFIIVALSLLTACVNNLNGLEDTEQKGESNSTVPDAGNVQIKVSSPSLHENVYMPYSKEALGLYVFTGKSTVKTDLYLENIPFFCTEKGFISKEPQYYPNQEGKSRFFSYFPHSEEGIHLSESQMTIKIETDQSENSNFYHSDFMIAEVANVTNGRSTAVHLPFKHKLAKLCITICPEQDDDLEAFLNEKPQIIIHQSFTQATYSLTDDDFKDVSTPQDIICNGEWTKENGKVIGKQVILIPQTLSKGQHLFDIVYKDSTFSCTLNESLVLESGKTSDIQLKYSQRKGISNILPSINNWEEGEHGTVEPEDRYEGDSILITEIDFNKSHIFQVLSEQVPIAEICLEYLFNEQINSQAITIYPIRNGKRMWDAGRVLYLDDETSEIHGGWINWDKYKSEFTYHKGKDKPWIVVFLDSQGQISNNKLSESLEVELRPLTHKDQRNNETKIYPLVKIGRQIWMQNNLNTLYYTDGSRIHYKIPEKYNETTAGVFKYNKECFYNGGVVQSGKLIQPGWMIADKSSWNELKSYLMDNAETLKNKIGWESYRNIESSDKTGFHAMPIGMFTPNQNNTASIYSFCNKFTTYWCMDTTNKFSDKAVMLRYDSNSIKDAKTDKFSGYSIRCVMENVQYINNQ